MMSELRGSDNRRIDADENLSNPKSEYSSSESGDGSSLDSRQNSNSERAQKRKNKSEKAPWSRLKRLKTSYSEGYRNLFNETVNEIVKGKSVDEDQLLSPSQIGITIWSSYEKDVFFFTLAKKGRIDLPGIAAAIRTKSELEVHAYIQLLQKATVEQHLHSPRNQLVEIAETSGAFEVSQDCCDVLERSADTLLALQQTEEKKLERKKHGDLWLLNQNTVRLARQHQFAQDSSTEILDRLPAAELLDLEVFLKLSSYVFMNSSILENNWRCYRSRKESPSIYYTAFADFHKLAVSMSKRLIQSSLFFAMSRIKATSSSNYQQKKLVKRSDISAALNVLGMEHNPRKFWVGAARRCNLAIYDDSEGQNSIDRKLPYDEIENMLGHGYDEDEQIVEDSPQNNKTVAISQPVDDSDQPRSDDESNISFIHTASEDNMFPSQSSHDETHSSEQQTPEEARDSYVQALDTRASQVEELRLWNLLGKDTSEIMESAIPRRPNVVERKMGDDLDDWRDWVAYTPEWETCGVPVSARSFVRRPSGWGSGFSSVSVSVQGVCREGSSGDSERHGGHDSSLADAPISPHNDEDNEEEENRLASEEGVKASDESDMGAP